MIEGITQQSRGGEGHRGFGVLWNLENEGLAHHFDRVVRMENGRVAEDTGRRGDEHQDSRDEREPMRASA